MGFDRFSTTAHWLRTPSRAHSPRLPFPHRDKPHHPTVAINLTAEAPPEHKLPLAQLCVPDALRDGQKQREADPDLRDPSTPGRL